MFSVILVDNASKINEAAILKGEFKNKRILFIRFEHNLGFVSGNNEAIKLVRSKYVVFLNNDTIVDPNWLYPLVKEMEVNSTVGACQPKIKLMDNPNQFDYAGASGGFIDRFGYPFTRGRIFFTSEQDHHQYDQKKEIFWASGAALAINRKLFLEMGMFDRRLFLYMEEIDLCWRLKNQGFTIKAVPDSIIYHKVAASASKHMIQKRFFEHRNNLLLLLKNYSSKDLITLFPIRLMFDFISLWHYLFKLNFRSLIGLILAHLSFWYHFPKALINRPKNNKNIADLGEGIYLGSIVIDYFVLNKNKFQQLVRN